jgi:hypothetical protein
VYTAKTTLDFSEREMASFWKKDFWPPPSPDLNPEDSFVWGRMKDEVQARPQANLDLLMQSITAARRLLDRSFIIRTCASFRWRREAVVAADGGYIE